MLIFAIVWRKQIIKKGKYVIWLTVGFLGIPLPLILWRIAYFWINDKDLAFTVVGSLVMMIIFYLYYKFIRSQIAKITEELRLPES